MNFKDIMVALGMIVTDAIKVPNDGINAVGHEGEGNVTAVGLEVKHLQVGDRVMFSGFLSPSFATEIQRLGTYCIKIRDLLSDEEAATMPVVYITMLLFLINKANLQKDQSVLIHSTAGGVGIAAIHVARWLGAEIYVTTGNDKKVEVLIREPSVPPERIFNSRNDSFTSDIMKATIMELT